MNKLTEILMLILGFACLFPLAFGNIIFFKYAVLSLSATLMVVSLISACIIDGREYLFRKASIFIIWSGAAVIFNNVWHGMDLSSRSYGYGTFIPLMLGAILLLADKFIEEKVKA
jgi:hypothetical protein